jgi:hypothetical protein
MRPSERRDLRLKLCGRKGWRTNHGRTCEGAAVGVPQQISHLGGAMPPKGGHVGIELANIYHGPVRHGAFMTVPPNAKGCGRASAARLVRTRPETCNELAIGRPAAVT